MFDRGLKLVKRKAPPIGGEQRISRIAREYTHALRLVYALHSKAHPDLRAGDANSCAPPQTVKVRGGYCLRRASSIRTMGHQKQKTTPIGVVFCFW